MKSIVISLFILLIGNYSVAQEIPAKKKSYIPNHTKLQFAGNIGFLSIGAGYLHGRDKLETDLMIGYLPESIGGDNIISLSLKMTYSPWRKRMSDTYVIYPISIGPYTSYSFGSQFNTILPNTYPDGYYWWPTSIRFGAFIGGKIEADQRPGSIALYYELGTYDLIFLSYIQNTEYLNLTDVFSLALGIKVRFN